MPNWCLTNYKIYGDEKDLRSLHKKMKNLENRKESLLPNGFGKNWLGNLAKRLGKSPKSLDCRGDWNELLLERDDKGDLCLSFNTETAWSRSEDIEHLILENYPNVSLFFFAEEGGCGIYETNDERGDVFPERYCLVTPEDLEYYTLEGLLKAVGELTGGNPTTEKEAVACIEAYNEGKDEDEVIDLKIPDMVD